MEIYMKLARHLENLVMGYPFNEALFKLLQEMFTPAEARIALSIPNNLAPFKTADLKRSSPVPTCPDRRWGRG